MIKKIFFLLFLTIILTAFTFPKALVINFKPVEKKLYSYTVINKYMDLRVELELTFEKIDSNETLVISKIKDVTLTDKTDGKFATNDRMQQSIGETKKNRVSRRGKILDVAQTSQLYNLGLMIVEFPDDALMKDKRWEKIKSAEPDIFFDSIRCKYSCISTSDPKLRVYANISSFNIEDNGLNTSRNYKGNYVINKKDGTVESVVLTLSGSSGISMISGKIVIKEISKP